MYPSFAVSDLQPRLLRCEYGGWLAVSGAGSPIRIAVIGLDANDARVRFSQEAERWAALFVNPAADVM